jgi:hypothetical protein
VPRDVTIELRLNRYLLPATAVRQAILVYAESRDRPRFLVPEYDVLERVLLFHQPAPPLGPLEPGLLYTVELVVPTEPGSEGLRAFDGAPLEPGPVPLQFHFRTARALPTAQQAAPEPVRCADALAVFAAGGCNGQNCHDAEEPRMGLNLDSAAGLVTTGIDRIAHQTAIGPRSTPLEEPSRLGVQMPIVDPGRPDNSYLMYKLLRHPQTFAGVCETRHRVPLAGQCIALPEAESTRLREWFVRGEPMPLEPPPGEFDIEDVRRLQRFIASGAVCP